MTAHERIELSTEQHPLKLRVQDFLLLDERGAFDAYAKTELLDGEIYFVNAQHRPHASMKMKLYDAIRDALRAAGSGLRPVVEASVELSEHDAPEPDIFLTSEPDGDGLYPGSSVALVVEVADTTLAGDLTTKAAIYARGGVPEYWVADVNGRVAHRLWAPDGDGYAERSQHAFGDDVTAATIAGLAISLPD